MPGLVLPPQPTLVMPQTLCLAFTEDRNYEQLRNEYHDGSPEAGQLAQTSRKTFKLSRRLDPSRLAILRTFWESLNGGLSPFLFYNPFDAVGAIGSNYDPTGANPVGRYVVRFNNNWTQVSSLRRSDVTGLELIEVAPMDANYEAFAGFTVHGAITAVTLNLVSAYPTGNTISPFATMYFDRAGGALPVHNLFDNTNWTIRTDSLTLGAFNPSGHFAWLTLTHTLMLTGMATWLVYDINLAIEYQDGATATVRPRFYALTDPGWTTANFIHDPGNVIDGDPATYATFETDLTDPRGAEPQLIVTW